MKCSSCGAEASGNFCASCGEPLATIKCGGCGAELLSGSRFCTGCGAPVSGTSPAATGNGAPAGNTKIAWWAGGALVVVALLALGYPMLTRDGVPAGGGPNPPPGMGGGGDGSGLVDLTTMPLEDQGNVLFNRVMSSSSAGDTADVTFFLPKALVVYGQLNPTDPDGLYHFALLHQVGGDHEAALAKAREGLAQIPDYLLLLAVAAEASAGLGDEAGARELYQKFLDVYDTEMGLMRPGYEHHQPIFPAYREEAQVFLNRG